MGIAIIKGEFGANALGRTMHNVTPKDPNRRKSFTNNDLKNTRWEEVNGVYKVAYINLGQATQHYKYALCDSQGNELLSLTGVSINLINGDITLDSNYDGSAVYAKVVPIIDNYYSTAINTTAVLVIDESGYTLDFAYNNSQGINARPLLVSMTSFAIYEDDSVVTTDKSELSNASVVVKENLNTIYSSDNISANLTIPGNISSTSRDLIVTIQGTYNGIPLSKSFVLPQGADAVDTIGTISYSGSLVKGTTINPNNFITTATYLSGKTPVQLHGVSVTPNTIQNSTATYTVTFEGNKSGQIELIPEDSLVTTKAYISGLPSYTGATNGPYVSSSYDSSGLYSASALDPLKGELPLFVEVTDPNNNTTTTEKYTTYLSRSNKKDYSLTVNLVDNNNNTISVDNAGTLQYNFTSGNYVYNYPTTKISSIVLTPQDGGTAISENYSTAMVVQADRWNYKWIAEEFDFSDISPSSELLLIHTAENYTIENSIILDETSSSGNIYKLSSSSDYYILIDGVKSDGTIQSGADGYYAIISIPNGTQLTAGEITIDGGNVKYVHPGSSKRHILIHHTPTSGYDTYIAKSSGSIALLHLLTPKTNN